MNHQTAEFHAVERKALHRKGAPALEPNVASPTVVHNAATGEPFMVVARFPGDLARYRRAALAMPRSETVRMGGTSNIGTTFGYTGRREVLRRHGCRACMSAVQAPAAHAVIAGTSDALAAQLASVLPDVAATGHRVASQIDEAWRMGGWWTSGVLNWMSPLPYHTDANNLPAWSAMTVVRRGCRGGHLHLPEWDLVIECRDGDVVYFPGYQYLHAVTPLRLTRDGYRLTAVYYTVKSMMRCTEDELSYARRHRSETEDTLLARQRAAGMLQERDPNVVKGKS